MLQVKIKSADMLACDKRAGHTDAPLLSVVWEGSPTGIHTVTWRNSVS
jgi:hypothetical protein